jgi:hypothetical protein
MKKILVSISITFLTLASMLMPGEAATPKIGVAAAVKNSVQRISGGSAQPLATGSDVFTSERIRTGEDSMAQILFLDKTTLTVGARAELTLDRFVYNPSTGTGRVVLNAVQGAFRFITGSQNPRNYTVKTPVGTLGVLGTIVDMTVLNNSVTVALVEGVLTFTFNGVTYTLDKPGTAYTFNADGSVLGPITRDGSIISTSSDVGLPLYGQYFIGEQPNNGLPGTYLNNVDQLNGIIQQGLKPPVTQPGIGGGEGGGGDNFRVNGIHR